jgi:CRISPR-associated endonuclease/helicase Cas3
MTSAANKTHGGDPSMRRASAPALLWRDRECAARLGKYWGKASSPQADQHHPAVHHCLDVAAVGRLLLEQDDLLRHHLATVSGLAEGPVLEWATFLLAIHDIGKLAVGFQALRPELMARLQGRAATAGYSERHDLLGYRLWTEVLEERLRADGVLLPATGAAEDWADLLKPWISAAAGHHGVPPRRRQPGADLAVQFPHEVRADACEMVRAVAGHLLPAGLPFDLERFEEQEDRFKRASWLFAGLAVAADWIGSNSDWFPFRPRVTTLAEYWSEAALPQARRAVGASGLMPATPSRGVGLRAVWPHLAAPTPLQTLAEELALAGGPQLVVIEEVTGGGKTEAALVIAHRLMAKGLAGGIYLGLPTMATANAMYGRVVAAYRRLYAEDASPSLVLAHSRRELFLPLERTSRDAPYTAGEQTGSANCAAWLADSRKKALLAHVGVGTIDQALLAVLPLRHQSLRLWGLTGKVLIVDEVHACDSYVLGLLCDLLEFHAALGGSAVLLSATLPAAQRRQLLAAFATGAGWRRPEVRSAAYPLVTHLSAAGLREHPVAARRAASRRVAVESESDRAKVEERILAVLAVGGCACWVRNTIGDALAAYQAFRTRLGPEQVTLFHSRFTVGDRARIEEETLRQFGPDSGAPERRGRLLVATQVVEQSLDLDFDLLVSDLAPLDLVVQRAGRLRRHARTGAGDRTDGADDRGPARLLLFGPQPADAPAADWFAALFPGGALVYPDHGRLWLGARWLAEHGGFAMPEDARDLIEHVYGPESEERIPARLRARTMQAAGESLADRALARTHGLKLNHGYQDPALDWPEDVYLPTRLGEPTVTLRLVRADGDGLAPWHAEGAHPWQRSEVQVRRALVAAEDPGLPAETLQRLRAGMPDEGRYAVVAVLTAEGDVWSGWAADTRGQRVQLRYSAQTGLEILRAGDGE